MVAVMTHTHTHVKGRGNVREATMVKRTVDLPPLSTKTILIKL